MLSPTFVMWDVAYPIYAYGSIFIIVLIIWQVKKNHRKLMLGHHKSCCQHHRRVKQRSRDRTSRAKRTSQEEAEKLQKLLSVMKSQGWLPQEGSVRRLLCADPSCQICNAMALEIQQLIVGKKKISSTLLGPSQGSSYPKMSISNVSCEKNQALCSQDSRELSLASDSLLSQLMDQKSLTRSASQSTGAVNVQYSWPNHLQQRQESQVPSVSQDVGALSSSSFEELGIPVSQQRRRRNNNSTLVLKNQEAPEVDLGNKMTFFSHWINPEVQGQKREEPILSSMAEPVAKPSTKEVEKSPVPIEDHGGEANLKTSTKNPEAWPPSTVKECLTLFDAPSAYTAHPSNIPFKSTNPGNFATPTTAAETVLN